MIDFFNDKRINLIREFAKDNHIPIMQEETAKVLEKTLKNVNPKNILEIGTAIGYSGLLILNSCNGFLNSVEIDSTRHVLSQKNIEEFNLLNRTNLVCDDAKNFISKLIEDGKKFDFIFLDGPKGQQYKYYPHLKNLLDLGGILFIDDVLYYKNFINENGIIPHKHRAMVNNLIKFNEILKSDSDFKKELLNIDEGVIIATKISL